MPKKSSHSTGNGNPVVAATNPTFLQIQEIIAGVVGLDPGAIYVDSTFEELGVHNFGRIINGINDEFEIELLPRKVLADWQRMEDPATIQDLVALVNEEQEWG
jgi:acyl carrier protein